MKLDLVFQSPFISVLDRYLLLLFASALRGWIITAARSALLPGRLTGRISGCRARRSSFLSHFDTSFRKIVRFYMPRV